MSSTPSDITTLGIGYGRYGDRPVGLTQRDRAQHLLLLGQTGTGKSTLLEHLIAGDIRQDRGFCLIDPHGDLAEAIRDRAGDDLLYWDVADPACPLGYNPITRVSARLRPLIVSGLIEALRKQWADAWGARMEHLLRYALLALLEQPRADLRDVMRLFTERPFRQEVIAGLTDPQVLAFWTGEYPALNYKTAIDGVAPIANKLGALLAHPLLRRALCEPETPLRFRRIMDEGRGLVVNLAKGRLGADNANVLGGLVLSSILHAAFTRQSMPVTQRRPFFLYVDEFHTFTTAAFAELLPEIRKYGVAATLAQQYLDQSVPEVQHAVLGNTGSLIAFRLGVQDTPLLCRHMPELTPRDFILLPNHRAYAQLMHDGTRSQTFTLTTFPPRARVAREEG